LLSSGQPQFSLCEYAKVISDGAIRRRNRQLLYFFEDFVLDTDQRELRRGPAVVAIAPLAFDLLDFLIRNRERVLSRDDLIASIWNGRIVSESALSTCVNVARSAINDTGEEQRLIRTLPRKGMRFVGVVREMQKPKGIGCGGRRDGATRAGSVSS
jgi:DNA-binding winged helix-turn-helix (wHTH) protein